MPQASFGGKCSDFRGQIKPFTVLWPIVGWCANSLRQFDQYNASEPFGVIRVFAKLKTVESDHDTTTSSQWQRFRRNHIR